MYNSEELLKKVRNIGRGMQTQMSDTVRTETKKVEDDLSNLRKEMLKLDAYMKELSSYIAEYNRCGYGGAALSSYHADVDTRDITLYLEYTRTVASSVTSFRYAFEEDYKRIASELDGAMYRLDDNHAQCGGALSSLHDKIYSAEHRLEECKTKLAGLERRLRDLQERIRAALERARAARANAAAIHIPPYWSWTDDDGKVHDNSAERAAAINAKNRYLAEAARHEAEAARLQNEANQVMREIEEVRARIVYLQNLLTQMRATDAELRAHLNELSRCRGLLYKCRESLKSIRESCMSQCYALNHECANAESNLVQAISSLNNYENTVLSGPQLQEWRFF